MNQERSVELIFHVAQMHTKLHTRMQAMQSIQKDGAEPAQAFGAVSALLFDTFADILVQQKRLTEMAEAMGKQPGGELSYPG